MSATPERKAPQATREPERRSVIAAVIDAIKPTPEELKEDEALIRRAVRESRGDSPAGAAHA